jgi:hypothetical protein
MSSPEWHSYDFPVACNAAPAASDVLSSAGLLDKIFESICRPLKVGSSQNCLKCTLSAYDCAFGLAGGYLAYPTHSYPAPAVPSIWLSMHLTVQDTAVSLCSYSSCLMFPQAPSARMCYFLAVWFLCFHCLLHKQELPNFAVALSVMMPPVSVLAFVHVQPTSAFAGMPLLCFYAGAH